MQNVAFTIWLPHVVYIQNIGILLNTSECDWFKSNNLQKRFYSVT